MPLPKKRPAVPVLPMPTPVQAQIAPPPPPPAIPSERPKSVPKKEPLEALYCLTEEEAGQPYNPARPNDYERIVVERRKRRFEEEIRRKKVHELQELEKERLAKPAAVNLNASGEQAYMERLKKSAAAGFSSTAAEDQQPKLSGEERAISIMRKMGWGGEGLGKEGQGRRTPLVMKKTDKSSGVIISSEQRLDPIMQKGTVLNAPPTRVVVLRNIDPAAADANLKTDIADGCRAYGIVEVLPSFVANS